MTTEPTQTPRTKAMTVVAMSLHELTKVVLVADCESIERDLAKSTQRIAELESRVKQLEELASLWSEYADFLYKANEGPITMAHAHGWRCSVDDVEKGREYRAKIAALSPSPPAVVPDSFRSEAETALQSLLADIGGFDSNLLNTPMESKGEFATRELAAIWAKHGHLYKEPKTHYATCGTCGVEVFPGVRHDCKPVAVPCHTCGSPTTRSSGVCNACINAITNPSLVPDNPSDIDPEKTREDGDAALREHVAAERARMTHPAVAQPVTAPEQQYRCQRCGITWEGPIFECPKCEQTDKVSIFQPDDAPPVQTEEKPSVDAYISQLYTDWCECSPYGEQVPDEWPELMAEFVKEHAGKDRDHMAELIMEASSDDSFEKLLLSIFRTSCQFVINDLSNAVYDHDQRKFALIGLNERKTEEKPATVPLAVAESQWQDIETAPRDGTEILLGYPGGVEPGWWQESVWLRGWCCGGHRSDAYGPDKEPTHWMPLPPAPATFQASTKE